MGIAAEVPSGQALRQGEGYNHFAPFVGAELGIEEGCFGKVGAEVGIGLEGFGGIHHFFFKQDIVRRRRYVGDFHGKASFFLHIEEGVGGRLLQDGSSYQSRRPAGAVSYDEGIIAYLYDLGYQPRRTEAVERPAGYLPVGYREVGRQVEAAGCIQTHVAPIELRSEEDAPRLTVGIKLVERSVVHQRQHLGRSGQAFGRSHHEPPFLFLTGAQAVAEDFPLHLQGAIGLGALQEGGPAIQLASLQHIEQEGDAFVITFQVRHLDAHQGIGELQQAALHTFPTCKDIHPHPGILERSSQAEGGLFASSHLHLPFVEEEGGVDRRASVFCREENERSGALHPMAQRVDSPCRQAITA